VNEPKVFLDYTQAELDRNYDQRGWVSNALEVLGRYPVLAAATRQRLKHEANVAYGPTPDETLDIFPAGTAGAATQIFIHGGAWRNFTKDDYTFVADGYAGHGITTVVVNFANVPQVRLPDMAAQVHRSVAWVYRNVERWGGRRDRIYLTGHSSGAHLAATALVRGWTDLGLPETAIRAAHLVSGAYDLKPVLLSARSSYIKVTPEEEHELSPERHAKRITCPVFVGYAEHDTDEFQRHSRDFAAKLKAYGRLSGSRQFEGVNHFEIMEAFGDPHSPLIEAIVAQM
jgi:arylformamidase